MNIGRGILAGLLTAAPGIAGFKPNNAAGERGIRSRTKPGYRCRCHRAGRISESAWLIDFSDWHGLWRRGTFFLKYTHSLWPLDSISQACPNVATFQKIQ